MRATAITSASLIACDERLDELRQPGDPVGNDNPRLSAPDPSDAHAEQITCKWLGEAIVKRRDGEHAPDSGHSRDRDVTAGFDPKQTHGINSADFALCPQAAVAEECGKGLLTPW